MTGPRRDRRVLANVGILGASQVSAQTLNVLALLLVARILGAESFGVVQVGVALSAYALLIAEMGLMSLGIRDLSRLADLESIRAYLRDHLGLLGALALATLGLGALVLPTLPFYDDAPTVYLLYLALVLPQWGMLDWVATGLQNQKWTGFFWVVRSGLYALLVALLLPREGTWLGVSALVWVPAFYWIAHVGADAFLGARVVRMVGGPVWPRFDRDAWTARLTAAAPIGGSLVVMRILFNADILLLGAMADARAAGLYASASKLVQVLVIGAEVVWKVLLPRLSQAWAEDPEQFRRDFSRALGLAVAALTPVAVGGTLLASPVVDFIYSDGFASAAGPLRQLAVAYPLLALGIFLGNGLIARDRQQRYLPSVALAAVTMVVLNLVWIPSHREMGASWAVSAAAGVLVLTTGWQMRADLRRTMLRPLLAAAVGGLVMAGVVSGLSGSHVLLVGILGCAAYGAVALPVCWRDLRRSQRA